MPGLTHRFRIKQDDMRIDLEGSKETFSDQDIPAGGRAIRKKFKILPISLLVLHKKNSLRCRRKRPGSRAAMFLVHDPYDMRNRRRCTTGAAYPEARAKSRCGSTAALRT
jgi:hypothetical protein